ncbi:MAG: hypothetical protein ACFE89_05185 [Candidatus Hodarchaeota archaeon]
MGLQNSLRQLPATAWQALKDYFAGLRLFFNRENIVHSVVFISTLGFFIAASLIQSPLRLFFFDPIEGIQPIVANTLRVAFFAGCGAFSGFLLLGFIALFGFGQKLLFKSRFRHFVSPLVVIGCALFFTFVIPPFYLNSALSGLLFGPNGFYNLIFRGSWILLVFFQVILLGYTLVKAVRWLVEYLGIPSQNITSARYWAFLLFASILIPILIWAWYPLIFIVMINGQQPGPTPPDFSLGLPVLWLLSLAPYEYVHYLWLVCPIVIAVMAIVLWKRLPSASIAVAVFGMVYPALVFYYRFRVNQYFINWSWLSVVSVIPPFRNFGLFEMGLLLLTFALVLLGAAKLQRNISPNPFGLYAMMIGTVIFVLSWVLLSEHNIHFGVEYFGMIGAALSALLAVITFLILPIAYGVYRMRRVGKAVVDQPISQYQNEGG